MKRERIAYTSVSRRLSFSLIGVVMLILLSFAGLAIYLDSSRFSKELEKRLENALQLSYIGLPTPLWNLDDTVVNDFLEALFLDKALVYAEVVWGDEIIAQKQSSNLTDISLVKRGGFTKYIDRSADILYEGNKVGTIRLIMSRESIKSKLAVSITGILALTLTIIAAIAFTSILITRRYIALPLQTLQSAASSIADGNLETTIEKSGSDEIGLLAEDLDSMRKDLKNLFNELSSSKRQIEAHSKTLEQEVKSRTEKLARSVDELKALSEVSQTVSSTLDIDTVLTTIVRKSVMLSNSDGGTIFEYVENDKRFLPTISYGISQELTEQLHSSSITRGDKTAIGQAAQQLVPVQIANLDDDDSYPLGFVKIAGFKALLAIPLIWDEKLIGGLVIQKKDPGKYPDHIVELLHTFAAQSVLAINNAKLFKEIEEKGRQIELADRHKSEFLANMSHELRTPLNAILGYTELIIDGIYGDVPEQIEDVLTRLDKNGRHLLNLINDILDISKIEAGQLELSIENYSMEELVMTVYTSVESLAAEKGLNLKAKIPADLPVGRGDQQRISQVLLNLLGNAIKFTEEGDVEVEVDVENRQGKDIFITSVSDTGPGLSSEQQNFIFKEFQQADGSSTREKGGTGLGLSIARRIVEMHGGLIWVESTPDQGSVFRFSIPVTVTNQREQP